MDAQELQERTKQFALRVMRLVDALPAKRSISVIANQLIRSATSVGANYRAACRARSSAEFFSKLSIVVEEADETVYWLELISAGNLINLDRVAELTNEARELLFIFARSRKTTRLNQKIKKS
jgi:four helix bundle protein